MGRYFFVRLLSVLYPGLGSAVSTSRTNALSYSTRFLPFSLLFQSLYARRHLVKSCPETATFRNIHT